MAKSKTPPTLYDPINATVTLGRKTNDKIDFTKVDPTTWQTYFGLGVPYTVDEFAYLKAMFIGLDDEKMQGAVLQGIYEAYFWQVKSNNANGSSSKNNAKISNKDTDRVLCDFISMRNRTYNSFADPAGDIMDYARSVQAGEFKMAGSRAEVNVKIAVTAATSFISSNPMIAGNAKLAANITQLFSSTAALSKKLDTISSEVTGVNAGIAGIANEIISAKDLIKTRTQLFTPEQLKDPKIQAQLKELAASEAALEERKKQAILINAENGKINVFDPYIGSLSSESVEAYKNAMKSYDNKAVGNRSLNQAFIPPATENNPLENKKNAQYANAFPKRPIGRPKGTYNTAQYNTFMEQRSINRIKKNFSRQDDLAIDGKLESQKTKIENFTRIDPRAGHNLVDHKDNSFTPIDPKIAPADRRAAIKHMLFGE
jgi:hypothetical protein